MTFRKVKTRTGKKIHIIASNGMGLCQNIPLLHEDVPANGPKCNCKTCLDTLKGVLQNEADSARIAEIFPPREEPFNEQRHSFHNRLNTLKIWT